ncbi:MAG: hypothetical protein NZ879_01450 [Archaeoglobaceae archaeon]|nr:hypothetical protein [Archaeoglobaceae archaeon]MDW8117629.1 hypothetical protein [Archaeoglobaceae archaeon]
MEEILRMIEELKEKSRDGWVIVVEGIKDRNALRMLGIEGEIVIFSGFLSTAERLKGKNVVILTDFDERGIKIEKGLMKVLTGYGKADVSIKKRIFHYLKKDVTKVEEIYTYFRREGYGGV